MNVVYVEPLEKNAADVWIYPVPVLPGSPVIVKVSRAFPTAITVRVTLPNRVQKLDLIKLGNEHESRERDDNRGAR